MGRGPRQRFLAGRELWMRGSPHVIPPKGPGAAVMAVHVLLFCDTWPRLPRVFRSRFLWSTEMPARRWNRVQGTPMTGTLSNSWLSGGHGIEAEARSRSLDQDMPRTRASSVLCSRQQKAGAPHDRQTRAVAAATCMFLDESPEGATGTRVPGRRGIWPGLLGDN
jgi:hypothetical protein